MSETAFTEFLESTPFLVIGPQGRRFFAHKVLLAKVSNVLEQDVNGQMKEKDTQEIEIKDVDGDIDDNTVMRFIECAYRGDYSVPEPKDAVATPLVEPLVRDEAEEAAVPEVPESYETEVMNDDEVTWEFSGGNKKKKKRYYHSKMNDWFVEESPSSTSPKADPFSIGNAVKSTRSDAWKYFLKRAVVHQVMPWQPRPNNDPNEDFSDVLMCHARLYKFSDRYGCPKLMDLSLQKLHLTLSRYTFHQKRASDIVDLVRYAYKHTMTYDNGRDKLRDLVLDYTVCYLKQLMEEPQFLKLLSPNETSTELVTANELNKDLLTRTMSMIG